MESIEMFYSRSYDSMMPKDMPKVTKESKAKQGGEKGCADTSLDKLAQLRKRGARKIIQVM